MVEAAEAASIYNVLNYRWKGKSAQKVTAKVTEKSVGFSWTALDWSIGAIPVAHFDTWKARWQAAHHE